MGVELRQVALNPAWGLVEAARRDRGHGDSLAMLPLWFTGVAGRLTPDRAGERADPVWRAACRLSGEVPDLASRVFDLDRRFDFLHWLLSATRRGGPTGPADAVIDHLFESGERVAEHVRATQGRPVYYAPPDAVFVAADVLAGAALPDRFDPAAAERAGVYKFFAGRDDAGWLADARRRLGELRAFVAAAAGRGDELIVVVD